jgi:ribosomal protein S18 acetylase RimI-like enzyme
MVGKMRRAQAEDDFWRVRDFLRQVFWLNNRRESSWHVARLDYWRWHFIKTCQACDSFEQVTFLWETAAGEIISVLHPVFMGEAFLHVHPGFRTPALENEMLSVAEEHLAARHPDGQRKLVILAFQDDDLRQRGLSRRGYSKRERHAHHWRRDLDASIPDGPPVTAGYTIRSMGDASEFPARSWASWRAFHPDEPDEDYEGWDWYHNIQSAPLYRRDLDIVAATPSGEIASFCTIWYDDVTRSGVCVLVGTVPEHQRRGLGKAVMHKGLRRIQRMGGARVFANGYDPAANALYGSVLGTCDLSNPWEKQW